MPSLDSVQTFTWDVLWSGQWVGQADTWREIKVSLPRKAVALKFEMARVKVSLDNVFITSFAAVPSAYLSTGGSFTCALHVAIQQLKCWGDNQYGQLGLGHQDKVGDGPGEMGEALGAVDVGTGRTAKQVSAGGFHTCALLDDSSIKCWGRNDYGQLGQGHKDYIGDGPGEMSDALPAVDLGTGRRAKEISTGTHHSCALLDDSSIKCWGRNDHGRLGQAHKDHIGDDPGEMSDALPAVDLGTGRTVKQVSAGFSHTCALLDDDSVKCWGRNQFGQLGQGHSVRIGHNVGEMGDALAAVDLGTGRRAKQLSTGPRSHHVCALLDDDSIVCWGYGFFGQLGQGSTGDIGDEPQEMGDNLPAINIGGGGATTDTNIRFVDGAKMQGRVQVQHVHQQAWLDVCDDNWTDADAQVVCQQLGLAGGVASVGMNGSGQFGMDDVSCIGSESNLGHCIFRGWGVHDCIAEEAAGVQCHLDAWSSLANPNISARRGMTSVWNADDRSMLVFAGHEANHFRYYNDLLRYTNGFWEDVQAFGPSSRGGHTAIWDPRSGTMLVFGGSFFTTTFDDLWLYNATANSWSLTVSTSKPGPRAYHTAVWNDGRQVMLVFAGENGIALADFWQYEQVSNQWTEILPSKHEKPTARSRHVAVWADAIQAMFMFGGWASAPLNDLWHYGMWTNSWTLLSPSNPPSGRAGHSAIWEPFTLSMLTFGGVALNASLLNYTADMWNFSFVTNTWTQLAPLGPYPSPEAREDHTAVWDPSSNFMYLLGGFDGSYRVDLWRYKSNGLNRVPLEECFAGQECKLDFTGFSFDGERLQVARMFGNSSELYFVRSASGNFSDFSLSQNATEDSDNNTDTSETWLFAEPGVYKIRNCIDLLDCEGNRLELGLLLMVGPFSGQSFVCDLGYPCIVTGLQGSRLSSSDRLLPLKTCGTSLQASTLKPIPTTGSEGLTDVQFGVVELYGFAPEKVQLCWCPVESDCKNLEDFRALAMVLHMVCPPGREEHDNT